MNRASSATYQQNHPEVHRIASASYQINHPKNHRITQTLYERINPENRTNNHLRAWKITFSGLA